MAEIIKVIELADGTLTNLVDKVSKLSVNYRPVTTWYDGSAMDNSKVDGDLYTRKGSTYYRKVIDKDGELFLEKDRMVELRALSAREILYLKAGVYKGVKLNGYYSEGDTPASIIYYLSDTTEDEDGGSVIDVGGTKLEHKFIQSLDIKYFGARSSNEDNQDQIQKALDYADGKGLEVIIPDDNGDFLTSNYLSIGSKTTLTFLGSFIKAKNYTTIGTIIFNKPNAEKIIINNPLIDADNIVAGGTGENGLSMQKVKNVRVYGGVIKNCKKGTEAFKLGGKALQFEAEDIEDVIVDGTRIDNCSWAISSQFNISANAVNNTKVEVSFQNIYAIDCENLAILHQSNGLEDSDNHLVTLNNITSVNCGNDDGLIVVSRLKNAKINNITVVGSNPTNSFIRGRHSQCEIKGIKVLQDMSSLIDNRPSFHGESTRESINNNYEFKLEANVANLISSSTDSSYANRELKNSTLFVNTNKDSFNFCVPQSAWNTTNIYVITPNKTILVNTTEAVLNGKNTPSAYNQLISIGSQRKLKSGTVVPNGAVNGDTGDIYLQEVQGYANIWFKYFGANTNTGWSNLMPSLAGTIALRPNVITTPIGSVYWNTQTAKLEVNNGTNYVDAINQATELQRGTVYKTTALANISQADLVAISTADATDEATAITLVNTIKSFINTNAIPLINATKTSQNTELTNQRTAGQQTT